MAWRKGPAVWAICSTSSSGSSMGGLQVTFLFERRYGRRADLPLDAPAGRRSSQRQVNDLPLPLTLAAALGEQQNLLDGASDRQAPGNFNHAWHREPGTGSL